MKDCILNLISTKPKHYARIIKNTPNLLDWVKTNSKFINNNIPEMVHSALHGSLDHCDRGNKKKFVSITNGFSGCGPASVCECTLESIRNSVIQTKSAFTTEQRSEINEKRNSTMIERYGVAYNSQRADIHHIWTKPKIPQEIFDRLNDKTWLDKEYNKNGRTAVDIAQELNVYFSTVIDYCTRHGFTIRQRTNYSIIEKNVGEWLTSLGVEYEHGNWKAIGKELDIYIPSRKLAIEIDGLYWHSWNPSSSKPEDKLRHITKTQLAAHHNIDLIHITDFEWINKTDIVKSILMSKLGLNTKIAARKCTIQKIPTSVEKVFLNKYHLQGYIPSQYAVGLYYNGNLTSIMSIGKSRFSTLSQYELLRYCTVEGVTVVGGGSRMLNDIRKHYPSFMTYCDLSKSSGNGYTSMGFEHINDTDPGYFWTNGNHVISRFKSQKSHLEKWLPSYNADLSQAENMFAAKYRRFYDCGNRVFLMK
jgi:hypothetical protein